MIILGHKAIETPHFRRVAGIDEIAESRANDIVWFGASDDSEYSIARHCAAHEIAYGVEIFSIKDALIFSQLGAKYLITRTRNLACDAQKIANEYFFDAKILCVIEREDEMEQIAKWGIDGVVFAGVLGR